MTRPVVVLRPEPGNAATAARVEAAGMAVIAMPIFAARALAWVPPDASRFDALLVTSAQAPRLAGAGLARLHALPAVVVGARTAAAAAAAGLRVAVMGAGDAGEVLARAADSGFARLLHLAGRDRTAATARIEAVFVYESVQTTVPEPPPGSIVLLHSVRAAQALAAAPLARDSIDLVAISAAVLAAAGIGWRSASAAARPDDAAMIAALRGCD